MIVALPIKLLLLTREFSAFTNNSTMSKLLTFLFFAVILLACHTKEPAKKNQGVITYKIEYPEDIMEEGFASFLPSKMISTFKDKQYKVSIKGDLSLYNLEYISKAEKDSSVTLFRVFDKRMFHQHELGEHLFLFNDFGKNKVEFIDTETKEIAGINCRKAVVNFQSPETPNITVYYSEEIDFYRPKENTPFDHIPGALMEFQIPFNGINLRFIAEKVDIKKIKDEEFIVPSNYTTSKRGEIDELVSALMQ
jgi:GLPGLI family protein